MAPLAKNTPWRRGKLANSEPMYTAEEVAAMLRLSPRTLTTLRETYPGLAPDDGAGMTAMFAKRPIQQPRYRRSVIAGWWKTLPTEVKEKHAQPRKANVAGRPA